MPYPLIRLKDCGEEILVDISEVLFNELAFFRLMQEVRGSVVNLEECIMLTVIHNRYFHHSEFRSVVCLCSTVIYINVSCIGLKYLAYESENMFLIFLCFYRIIVTCHYSMVKINKFSVVPRITLSLLFSIG